VSRENDSNILALFNFRQKTEASWHRKGRRYEYGIALVQAKRYQQYPNLLLIIHETKTGEVLYARFADLMTTARVYPYDKIEPGGTLFVPKCSMEKWIGEQCIYITRENGTKPKGQFVPLVDGST